MTTKQQLVDMLRTCSNPVCIWNPMIKAYVKTADRENLANVIAGCPKQGYTIDVDFGVIWIDD